MSPDLFAGGDVAMATLREGRTRREELLRRVFGNPFVVEQVLTDKSFRSLVLPVLHSNGLDLIAVQRLRAAVWGVPKMPPNKVSMTKVLLSEASEETLGSFSFCGVFSQNSH